MRKALIILSLLLSISTLSARTITGIGYGSTPEEALEEARRDLISRFSISVSSLVYSTTNDNGYNADSSFLSTSSVQYSSVDIKGESKSGRKEGDTYIAESSLDEYDAPAYYTELQELGQSIPRIKNMIDNETESKEKLDLYRTLISIMKRYESDREIISQLAPDMYTFTPLPFSRVEIEAEYSNLLSKESNSLDLTIKELERQSSLDIISAEGEKRLQEARNELEENIKYQQDLQEANENDYNLHLEMLEQSIRSSAAEFSESFNSQNAFAYNDNSFSSLMNTIEADRAAFKAMKDSVSKTLSDISESYEDESKTIMQRELSKPYASTQLDENNNPKPDSKERRIGNANKMIEERKTFYETASDAAYTAVEKQLEAISRSTIDTIDTLNASVFTVTNHGSGISTVIKATDFDTENKVFHGTAYIPIADSTLTFSFRIPFYSWAKQEELQNLNEDDIDYMAAEWIEIFEDYPSSFTIEARLKIESNKKDNKYRATILDYSIKKAGETKIVYSESINKSYDFTYGTNVNVMDFSVSPNDMISNHNAKKGIQSLHELTGRNYPLAITVDSMFAFAGKHTDMNIALGASAEIFFQMPAEALSLSVDFGAYWNYIQSKDKAGSYELIRVTHMLGLRSSVFVNGSFPLGDTAAALLGVGLGVDTRFNGGTYITAEVRGNAAIRGAKQSPAFLLGINVLLTTPDLTNTSYGIKELYCSMGLSLGVMF